MSLQIKTRHIFLVISICLAMVAGGCKSSKQKHDKVETGELPVRVETKRENHYEKEDRNSIDKMLKEAKTWIGTPYKYGASEKGKATDCSGMVCVLFENFFNEKLPRNSAKQAEYCNELIKEKVKAGDLVFFATGNDPNEISHVGIMLDKENFIHASASKGVIISEITTPYYQRKFIMFGRVPFLSI